MSIGSELVDNYSWSSVVRGMNSKSPRHKFDFWAAPLSKTRRRSRDGSGSNPEGLPNLTTGAGISVARHPGPGNALNEGPGPEPDYLPIPLH